MPRITYVERDFSPGSMQLIVAANKIIAEYQRQGFNLTLRQLYYQFVSRALLANRQTEYKRLGSVINDARLAGLVDWMAIEDRTRNLETLPHWRDPEQILESIAEQFRTDRWRDQEYRVEVWVEKEALVGVLEGVCERNDVPYFACRGYTSQSEQWRAAMRFKKYREAGQLPVVLYLGDHDPSGIDMTRDHRDRLAMFVRAEVRVIRLALNMDQVEEHNPPPNPAKLTDSRATGYIQEHGDESWELDALEPTLIAQLIQDAIDEHRDPALWEASEEADEAERETLRRITESYDDIKAWLEDRP